MKLLIRMILGCQYQISDLGQTKITIESTVTAASMKSCLLFWNNIKTLRERKENIYKPYWQMETSSRKYLDVIGCFLPFSKNVVGPNVKRFIERPMEHMSAHVYTKKDEVSQNKKKQTNICLNRRRKNKLLFNPQQIKEAQSNLSLSPSLTGKSKHHILAQCLIKILV